MTINTYQVFDGSIDHNIWDLPECLASANITATLLGPKRLSRNSHCQWHLTTSCPFSKSCRVYWETSKPCTKRSCFLLVFFLLQSLPSNVSFWATSRLEFALQLHVAQHLEKSLMRMTSCKSYIHLCCEILTRWLSNKNSFHSSTTKSTIWVYSW